MRRRAARKDANHNTITHAFIALGCSVRDGSRNADGWADLAVGLGGVTHLCEIKDGSKSPSRRKRTEAQVRWSAGWRGEIVHIVESVDDVQRLVGVWREQVVKSVFASAGIVSSAPPSAVMERKREMAAHGSELIGSLFRPGEWLPMPHKDSPTVFSQPADGRCFVTQIIDGRHENRCIRFAGHLGDCAFPTVSR